MAITMDALLKIKAITQGEGAISGLSRALGGLQATAGKTQKTLTGMLSDAGGLSQALGMLVPLASAAGLAALATNAINTASQFSSLSKITGVSVEQLSALDLAARDSGVTIEDVAKAISKVAAATAKEASDSYMRTGVALGNSLEAQVEAVQVSQQRQVDAIKTAAADKVAAVREGERRDTQAVQDAADERQRVVEKESDLRLKEINRRYRQEQKLTDDKFDDQRSREQEAAEDQQRILERQLDQRYELKKTQIENDKTLNDQQRKAMLQALQYQQQDEREALADGFREREKIRDRAFRDEREAAQQAIQDRQQKEEDAIKASAEKQKKTIQDSAKDRVAVIKAAADKSTKIIQSAADDQVKALTDESSKAAQAFRTLGVSLTDGAGNIRQPLDRMLEFGEKLSKMPNGINKTTLAIDAFGNKLGPQLIPFLNKGKGALTEFESYLTTEFAKSADLTNAGLVRLQGQFGVLSMKLGVALMPLITKVTNGLIGFGKWFSTLPGWVQDLTIGIAGLAAAFVVLAPAINGVVFVIGAIGSAIPVIIAALGGLLAWIGTTLIPGLLAFFSGPVGWTVLAVAAVVAMAIAFREPIMQFATWFGTALYDFFIQPWVDLWNNVLRGPVTAIWEWMKGVFKTAFTALYAIAWQLWVQPWINLWNVVLRTPVTAAWTWLKGVFNAIGKGFMTYVATPISNAWRTVTTFIPQAMAAVAKTVSTIWTNIINTIRGVFNGFVQAIASRINGVANVINALISRFNALPGPDVPLIPQLNIPAFAKGGYVTSPTIGMVGEGGQPEYIIPSSQMAAASQRYLAGARGADVLAGGPTAGTAAPTINITTGPVVAFEGERYVKVEDLERAMRITAEGVMGRLRTPSARIALGIG
jgi:hypothetical protein